MSESRLRALSVEFAVKILNLVKRSRFATIPSKNRPSSPIPEDGNDQQRLYGFTVSRNGDSGNRLAAGEILPPFCVFGNCISLVWGYIMVRGVYMKEKLLIRLFVESDAGAVQDIIHRGLREINGKDYPAELIEKYCAYFTLEKIKSQAASAHMYVAVWENKIVGTGSIAPYWGSEKESILLTIYVLPEMIGQGVGSAIINTLEQDEYFLRAERIEIPSSVTAVKFYQKMGYGFKNGIIPDAEGIVSMEKFRNVKLLSIRL